MSPKVLFMLFFLTAITINNYILSIVSSINYLGQLYLQLMLIIEIEHPPFVWFVILGKV